MTRLKVEQELLIREVRKLYVFPKDNSVTHFLEGHRNVPQLLIAAVPVLEGYFGTGTIFVLRAPTDEQGSQSLYAVVMWPGSVEDVANALDHFEDEWWLSNSRQSLGRLTFTYELA